MRRAYHAIAARWHRWRSRRLATAHRTARTPLEVSIAVTRLHLHTMRARYHGERTRPRRSTP